MKKTAVLLLFIMPALSLMAQDIDKVTALQTVAKNKVAAGLSDKDLQNTIVSGAYYDRIAGIDLIYLQQTYHGLPVFNSIQTLAVKNGTIVSNTGGRIKNISQLAGKKPLPALITAADAVAAAMADKQISTSQKPAALHSDQDKKINFGKAGISKEDITAQLMWIPLNDGKDIQLAWQVYFAPAGSPDFWLLNVDAISSKIISEVNLTVYCSVDGEENHPHTDKPPVGAATEKALQSSATLLSPAIVNNASYRVVPFPAESPNHPGGTPATRFNPWALAPGNATSLKWHSNGTTDYNITRGNNVFAAEDRDGSDATAGLPATSTTGADPLSFDFAPDFTAAPTQAAPVPNQQFNITNLFYWNNIIHDLVYQYGFDEAAGNFQANNQGRGGQANDYVIADAQDGSGSSNANFATPVDGQSGRMQMYLWSGTPQKDGDADNGIIVHEFSHGISNRLAGGPAQAACVSNAEQMGEGWSDYYALMATQDWANSQLTDGFNVPRGIGTYALGQTPAGPGIRSQRYCTNFAINNRSYAATIPGNGQQHSRGEIWCATLWDMTWNIINQTGSINPDIFNGSGAGGNSIALRLVTEGLKLQPCNAGFLDARDGILKADQVLYNGAYRCAIMQAFARRGMGFDASQGSPNSTTDQVPGFSMAETILSLTQNITQQAEGLNIIYTNKVTAGLPGACSGITNYLLTDTLPSNVTYISGGTYNSATRVVSFAVNLAASQTQTYSFTVQVNSGSWFATSNLMNETVAAATLPAGWAVPVAAGTNNFTVSSAQSHSAPNSFFAVNADGISDFSLASTTPVALGTVPPVLSFWHNYNTEDGWDGGVAEISINGGTSWADLGANMTENGYNGNLGSGSNNPLAGRYAFTGNSNGFIRTSVSLLPYANQNALFRFRMSSDDNTPVTGWYIDDILLQSRPLVNIRSSLFNASGVRMNVKDTFTLILQNNSCSPVSITTQPVAATVCAGSNAHFVVTAAGTNIVYQWQVSTDAGINFADINGATGAALDLTAVSGTLNNNRYRVTVSNNCPSSLLSVPAILNITAAPAITQQPAKAGVCLGAAANFTAIVSGINLAYQWQVSSNAGSSFSNIVNGSPYTGANTSSLNISPVPPGLNASLYRLQVNSGTCNTLFSANALLSTSLLQSVVLQAANTGITPSHPVTLQSVINPPGSYTYQWFANSISVAGANGNSYEATADNPGNYVLKVTDASGCSVSSAPIVVQDSASNMLFIYPNPGNGRFQVRYYSASNTVENRRINIYDGKGSKVYSARQTVGAGYTRMDVILTNVPAGIYRVELRNEKGERLAAAPVIIQ